MATTPSRRVQIARLIRDAVAAVPEFADAGGCDMLRQSGVSFAALPVAVVHIRTDDPTVQTAGGGYVDSGEPQGGTTWKALSVVVAVYTVDSYRGGVDAEQQQPQSSESTIEFVDELLAKAEAAIAALDIQGTTGDLAEQWRALGALLQPAQTAFMSTEDGMRLVGGFLSFSVRYSHREGDPGAPVA